MAKKKPTPDVEVTETPVAETEAGQWEAWFTPQWHTMLHCGVGSFEDMQQAVYDTVGEFVVGVFGSASAIEFNWQQGEDGNYYAYGMDGSPQQTTLPLAKLVRVG